MLSFPESTSFKWRPSVKTAPEKRIFVIFAFQAAKDGDQTKYSFTFVHVNLKNAYVTLISDPYPAVYYNLWFQKFSWVYGDASLFEVKFFYMDELTTQSNIIPSDYKTLYRHAFDVSKQREKLKFSVVDIQIMANFTENVSCQHKSICTIYFCNMLLFQSGANKMSAVY